MKEIKLELNAKGILLVGFLILALTFGFGYACKQRNEVRVTFTKADLKAVEQALEMYGDDIEVMKDNDGNLILNLGEDVTIQRKVSGL